MNLKESFRYQKFLDSMLRNAGYSITTKEHCLNTEKIHLMSQANPDANDKTEVVEKEPFYPNDTVIGFIMFLVEQKRLLSEAIGKRKFSQSGIFELDAEIALNKYRQHAGAVIKEMLRTTPSKRIERGQSWKFNNEGVQAPYYYDVEVVTTEAFDRDSAKKLCQELVADADKASAEIDKFLINNDVDYDPPFDVNDSFEDAMEEYLAKINPSK